MSAAAVRRSPFASLPRIATRRRTSDDQMSMFTVISVGTIAFMMLVPSPRAAFASVEPDARVVRIVDAASERARIELLGNVDQACAGQAWGSETLDCILAIARDSGIDRSIRLADARH